MPQHWMPAGWYIKVVTDPPGPATWETFATGVPLQKGGSPNGRQADRDATAALFRAMWSVMDQGWTRGRDGRGSVVHLRIKGQPGSICGVKQLDEGPNINCIESSPCGRCEQIERGTIARYVPEVAEAYELEVKP